MQHYVLTALTHILDGLHGFLQVPLRSDFEAFAGEGKGCLGATNHVADGCPVGHGGYQADGGSAGVIQHDVERIWNLGLAVLKVELSTYADGILRETKIQRLDEAGYAMDEQVA